MTSLSSTSPLLSHRKKFSSPFDHHCSNSDRSLPPSSSYLCLIKLCITLHQIPVFPHCTPPHPYSQVSTIYSPGKKKKKKICCLQGWVLQIFTIVGKKKKEKYKKTCLLFLQYIVLKIKPFIACRGELSHGFTMAYSKRNSVISYDLINAHLTMNKSISNICTKQSQWFCFTTVMTEPPWLNRTGASASDKVPSDKYPSNRKRFLKNRVFPLCVRHLIYKAEMGT